MELHGRLDSQNSTQLTAAVEQLTLDERGATSVGLDLAGLHYASSTGIGALVNCTLLLRRIGIELILVDTPPHILSIIELLGFSASLHFQRSAGKS